MKIFVLAGTSDARELAIKLKDAGYSITASVVTDNAAIALKENAIETTIGRLTSDDMKDFLLNNHVVTLVDGSHPFAEEVSRNAIEAAKSANIPYYRYERESYKEKDPLITEVESYSAAAELAAEWGGVVMLTTGSKTLEVFTSKLNDLENVRLIARMLPRKDNMEKCAELGVEQKNIIAIQGPFSKELNKALYMQYEVNVVVTKESGKVGSVDEKVEAARELNIPIIMIKRPIIEYGNVYSNYQDLIEEINYKRSKNNGF